MIFYRAMPLNTKYIRSNDYITKSKKFAIEHAITTSIYHGEDYGIYRVFLDKGEYKEANNPGEYLYIGDKKEARLIGVAKYDDFRADSEFKKVSHTLYHGTIKDNEKSIRNYGLEPQVGRWVEEVFSGIELPEDEGYDRHGLVFAADKHRLGMAVYAMIQHIAFKLNKDVRDVDEKDIIAHGMLVIIKDGESYFHKRPDDERLWDNLREEVYYETDNPLYAVEPNDWFSTEGAPADIILTGNKLLTYIKSKGEYPLKDIPESHDYKSYALQQLIKNKKDEESIEDIKKIVEESSGRELQNILKSLSASLSSIKLKKCSLYIEKLAEYALFDTEHMIDLDRSFYHDYYPDLDESSLNKNHYYRGNNVIWIGTPGKMIRVDSNAIYPIEGNIFNSEKISQIASKIINSEKKTILYAPYGVATKVDIDNIRESIEYSEATHKEDPSVLTTGNDELDEYILNKKEYFENLGLSKDDDPEEYLEEEARLEEELKNAISSNDGDIGRIIFQIRDGNHRAFGAVAAGEPYIWVSVSDNQIQDIKEGYYTFLNDKLM